MSFQITALYASIFAIMMIVLANMVSAMRTDSNISILHGDNMLLALRMRRHGNFIENIPMALIMMMLIESQGASVFWLHLMGIILVVARVLHVIGIDAERTISPLRLMGGIATQLCLVSAAGFLIFGFIVG